MIRIIKLLWLVLLIILGKRMLATIRFKSGHKVRVWCSNFRVTRDTTTGECRSFTFDYPSNNLTYINVTAIESIVKSC